MKRAFFLNSFFLTGWIVFFCLGFFQAGASESNTNYITSINPKFVISPEEALQWHEYKDKAGPTYSGNSSWKSYLAFLEEKLKKYGVVDMTKNSWSYDRWYTSDWPDSSNWTLVSNGQSIKVAHYGAYSGSTLPEGITRDLILYNPSAPPETFKDKLVVFMAAPHPAPPLDKNYKEWFTLNDYEYRSSEDFPPLFTSVPPSETVSYDVWWQLRQTALINSVLKKTQAAGGIMVFNMAYDRLAGLYTFPIPTLSNTPALYLGRKAGAQVIQDAKDGKKATLKLLAKVEPTETYQLIGYLPGKNYGTAQDEKIVLTSHTDGPAVLQDNGALGVLAIVAYFSHIPQSERPRTLMIYLDNRHYMPGMEKAFETQDYFARKPEAKKSIVALVATEHLGQIEFREKDDKYEPTGKVEPAFLWTRNNQKLIDMAIKAVKDHHWPRVMVQCVERPGSHGGSQGVWYGMGKIALDWNLPAFATMGTQGAYWATTARINTFNKNLFYSEVAAMTQLTGELMNADLK
jgi:hypothetical protein